MKPSQPHGSDNGVDHHHGHGGIDPKIAGTRRGKWAVKWSFAVLMLTALMQVIVVVLSGSVALLADTLHNIGDGFTALPLWIAFSLVHRQPTRRFTYGLGRLEDLAGVFIVLVNLAVNADLSVAEGHDIAESARRAILRHSLPHLSNVVIHVDSPNSSGETFHHQA